MELSNVEYLIALAKEIIDKHSLNEFEALKMAEKELENIIKEDVTFNEDSGRD